jgi:transcriptional regulator with XRE-family HTH domain
MDAKNRDRLAHKIKLIRGKLKQSELAVILGVAPASISGWENGKNIPTIENLEKLAELANQLPEEFLAEVYGRKITTEECPTIAFAITAMGNKEISDALVLIAQKISGGGK